jgi:hypothetical protein
MGTSAPSGKFAELYESFLGQVDRPGWKKFVQAIGALGLAFLLAIYSSIFAQQGRVLATGLCASLALLLAGYVALTVVPYLARRTRLEWLRISLDYKLTREGMAFIALILILAVAGLNTGNNLLYLILSSMLAAILVSGILSLAVLSGIELEILLPDHVFARRPVPARIHIQNGKHHIPSFSITLSSASDGREARRKKADKEAKRQATSGTTPPEVPRRILRHPLYFAFLPGGRAIGRTVELEFPKRGLYREAGFFLSTRFPFGFLEKKLRLPVSRELWVYPAVQPTEEFYEILPMLSGELRRVAATISTASVTCCRRTARGAWTGRHRRAAKA